MVVYPVVIAEANLFKGWYSSWPKADMWDVGASPLLVCGFFFTLCEASISPKRKNPWQPSRFLPPLSQGLSSLRLFVGGPTQRKTVLWLRTFLLWAEVFPPIQSQAGCLPNTSRENLEGQASMWVFSSPPLPLEENV